VYEELRKRIPVCEHAAPDGISLELLKVLAAIESELDTELEYGSGYRCPECNKEAKGKSNSAHLRGLAVDIRCSNSHLRFLIYDAARLCGVVRLGPAAGFLHLDVDKSLPQEVVWLYD